jgi:hypothetical protein
MLLTDGQADNLRSTKMTMVSRTLAVYIAVRNLVLSDLALFPLLSQEKQRKERESKKVKYW